MKRLLAALALLLCASASAATDASAVLGAMRAEMKRAQDSLVAPDGTRPYYLAVRFAVRDAVSLGARRGLALPARRASDPALLVEIRVGSPELDDSRFEGTATEGFPFALPVSAEGDSLLLRRAIWAMFDDAFRQAVRNLAEKRAWLKSHPRSRPPGPDFVLPERHSLVDTLPPLEVDTAKWTAALVEASRFAESRPFLVEAPVALEISSTRRYAVDSRGSFSVTDERRALALGALLVQADDGTPLWDYWRDMGLSPDEIDFAGAGKLLAGRADALDRLRGLPQEEPYRGPVLLSGDAAGAFVWSALGSALFGGEREMQLGDGAGPRHLVSALGRRLLPRGFALYDLPALSSFDGKSAPGRNLVDHEGNLSRDVAILDDGMLRELPTGQQPVSGQAAVNGHWRHGGPFPSTLVLSCPDERVRKGISAEFAKAVAAEGIPHGYEIERFEDPEASMLLRSPLADEIRGRVVFSDVDVIRLPVPTAMFRVDANGVRAPARPLQPSSQTAASYREWALCGADHVLHTMWEGASVVAPSILHAYMQMLPQTLQGAEPVLLRDQGSGIRD